MTGVSDGETENGNLPNLPEVREEREKEENNLPGVKTYQSSDREIREEREISSNGDQKHLFYGENIETGVI